MQPVSATDAIGLAFTHTRAVLAPGRFRLGRFFKLALLAAVTQASFLSVSFNYPVQGVMFAGHSHGRHAGAQFAAGDGIGALAGGIGLVVLLVVLGLVVVVTLVYLWLLCRARATLFDLVVFRGGRVREAWRRRGRPGLRYLGLYLLAMLAFLAIVAAVLGPVVVRLAKMAGQAGGFSASPGAGSLMLTLAGLIWLLLPLWIAVDLLLQDFILPGLVLGQDAPVSAAFARLGGVLQRKPGQVVLFLILRTVVGLAIGVALGLVTLICVGLLALLGSGVGWVLYFALWKHGVAGHAVFFAYVAGAGLVIVALYLLCIIAVYGITGTFKASYAAWFYAGYYPDLAVALEGRPPEEGEFVGAGLPMPMPPLPPLKADIW
jgi:hypothetical protein